MVGYTLGKLFENIILKLFDSIVKSFESLTNIFDSGAFFNNQSKTYLSSSRPFLLPNHFSGLKSKVYNSSFIGFTVFKLTSRALFVLGTYTSEEKNLNFLFK